MAYLKPQSPLQHKDGDYFYPLTTADQVILPDGSRLNSNFSTYNYLDNSNFEQFIAQAGIGGLHGTQAYAGDRWILDSGTVTGAANENGNGYSNIVLNGTIRQIVANPPDNGTVVIEMVSGTASASYANGEVTVISSGGVIKNIALYACEESVATLFKYRPKGYGAELAECLRYFEKRRFLGTFSLTDYSKAFIALGLNYTQKRITPTISVTRAWSPGTYETVNDISCDFVDACTARIKSTQVSAAGLFAYVDVVINADL